METFFVTAFATIVAGVGGGMAFVSLLPISKRSKRAALAPLLVATMILGTRFGFLHDLGPQGTFTGNPAGQVIGVLLGLLAVWLVFFREPRRREGQLDAK